MRNGRRLLAVLIAVSILAISAWCEGADSLSLCLDPQEVSAQAFYNQGNVHAHAGEVGLAVLCYERARVYRPRDPDVEANLERVREKAGLSEASGWLQQHARMGNPNLLYGLGILGLLLTGAGVLCFRFNRRKARWGLATIMLGAPLSVIATVDAVATWPVMREAVVLHATVARVSPAGGGEPLFAIPEGQVVETADEYQGFILVQTDPSHAGWVAQADLAPVI